MAYYYPIPDENPVFDDYINDGPEPTNTTDYSFVIIIGPFLLLYIVIELITAKW
jgi:hypothetical protein